MKICKKCIIPDSFPNITFSDGICRFCRDHKQFTTNKITSGHDKLLEILRSKKRDESDCVIPVSGGKDSAYILFYVVRKLGLKPLAFFFDSGFATEVSKKNVESMCSKLSVDLVIVKSTSFRRKVVREALHLSKCMNRFERTCGNCENNLRTAAINEATRRNIPFILWGSTNVEDTTNAYDVKWEAGRFRTEFGEKKTANFWHLLKNVYHYGKRGALVHILQYRYYIIRDNIGSKSPEGWNKFNPFLQVSFKNKKVQTIYFFDYIAYNPFKQIEILKRELAWETPLNKEVRVDCKLHCFDNYEFLRRTGITKDGFYLANLVREGLLSRADAIEKEEAIKKDLRRQCEEMFKELGFNDYELV